MAEDRELAEVARKIDEAKVAAEEEKRSRPYGAEDDDVAAPQRETDEGFSPT